MSQATYFLVKFIEILPSAEDFLESRFYLPKSWCDWSAQYRPVCGSTTLSFEFCYFEETQFWCEGLNILLGDC